MNKSIRKINLDRLKIRRPSTTVNPYSVHNPKVYQNKSKDFYNKTLRQVALCIVLVLLVILIKNINTPLTDKTEELIKSSLVREFDVKKSFDKVIRYVKEIPSIPDKVVNVFQTNEEPDQTSVKMIPPINGEIVSDFGENVDPILNQKTFQRGIDILVSENQIIKSIGEGEVVEIGLGNSLGKYIKIKHDEEFFSIYGNCSAITVSQGQKVKQGQPIAEIHTTSGSSTSNLFHFELWVEGNVVDPTSYIQFEKRIL